uniref:Immunoglobulin domain-containing protein n=1 Tax=Cyprinus carpio TaxID=7962 RepID=A0A8C2BVZ4_CYPCA
MEGDSVTLHNDLTQIEKFSLLEWKFGDPVIARIDGKDISYPSPTEIFRDRLQLDETGPLTIKNMKTKHSGLYELQISHSDGISESKFNVTVYESPSEAGKADVKSLSVKEGAPVTLQTDVKLDGDELIVWRCGDKGRLIAKADIEAKSSTLYDTDERFRGDHQTGSLTITDTRTTDSGFYTVKISSKKQTSYQRFTLTVSGE